MLTFIIIGFISAILAPFVHRYAEKISGILLSIIPVSIFIYLWQMMPAISSGHELFLTYDWFPSMGVTLNFYVDGLGLTFGLIISGIGAIITYYASGYLKGHKKLGRFYGYLLFFMTSMLGVVLTDDIIALFIFWELTSISSYLLIGFNHEQERSRYAALQALIVTGGGGLALLAGLIIMGSITDTFSIQTQISQSSLILQHTLFVPVVILVFAGAFTKSAQFPFHFWLPNAMEAPTPVSAYLHSATMVKAGVYLVARFNPMFSGTEIWQTSLLAFGGLTMLTGAAMAIGQNDLKRILAYTTVSALGIMIFLIGIGGKYAITAAVTFLVVHAMYKGALFLVAGAIDHETGTRDIRKLNGLRKYLPAVFVAAFLSALSYAGIPPFLGFIAKELIYEATSHTSLLPEVLTSIAVLTNMLLVATAIMVGIKPFFGTYTPTPHKPHPAPLTLWLGPVLLGSLGLILGLFPHLASYNLVQPSVNSVSLAAGASLALWHGFTPLLLLSLLTLAGGVFFFWLSNPIKKQEVFFNRLAAFGPEEGYNSMMRGLVKLATVQTKFFQDGYLRHYFLYIIVVFLTLVLFAMHHFDQFSQIHFSFDDLYFYEALIAIIMLLAAFTAVQSKSVLASIAALGIVGYGVALIFAFSSAPDLALTQFSIETLTVILLVLVVYKVPAFASLSNRKARRIDIILSAAVGLTITLLMMLALAAPPESKISTFFLENSYVKAHGRNVVNVILVDFRGLDTMGEITVLSIAAIGVYTLLKFRRSRKSVGQ
ncbi:MAG: putative monovalent cation/H+ antiporter subunit A [Bacteroidales bacterium]